MMTNKEAMKLALEGAANYIDALGGDSRKYRQALANEALDKKAENARELGLDYEPAQQEPFGYFKAEPFGWTDCAESDEGAVALYERPQPAQRTWVGLTDEELKPLCAENHIVFGAYTVDFIRAIEAKLRSKNEDRN